MELNATSGNYEYTVSSQKVTITKYTGNESHVIVPNEIDGYPVTKIGTYAFDNKESIQTLVIPEGVIEIGSSAFQSCTGIRSISLPQSLEKIGSSAFNDCSGFTSITLPESLTSTAKNN